MASASSLVFVDTNPGENALFASLVRELGGDVVKRQRLDIGDVHLVTPHGKIIVERKRWGDLQSSLNDKRYSEQKLRLLGERERDESGKTHVVVLVESRTVPNFDGEAKPNHRKNKPAFCALAKMSIRDRIAVVWCADSDDAGRHIAYMFTALLKDGFNAGAKATSVAASGYAATAKHTNKRKCADDAAFEMMLATINGMSGARAKAVSDEYSGSMARLVGAYTDLQNAGASQEDLDDMLADVKVGDKRLGPALSKRVRTAVFGLMSTVFAECCEKCHL